MVDLTADLWEALDGWQDQIIFDEDIVCAASNDHLASLTKRLDGPRGGLTLHISGVNHSIWSGAEGEPGEAARIWTISLKGWCDARPLEGRP